MGVDEILRIVDDKKEEIRKADPLPKGTIQSLDEDYVLRYVHETTAIEGNTLTIGETQVVLEDGLVIAGKTMREHLEVLNIRKALQWLERKINSQEPITQNTILDLHGIILQGIGEEGEAGFYRRRAVRIRGSQHIPPNWVKVPELMDKFSDWVSTDSGDEHPIIFAAKAHVKLTGIHPFVDGNKRTGRLLTSLLLMRADYPPAMFTSANRLEYITALEDGYAGNVDPFVVIVGKAVEYMEDRYLEMINQERESQEILKERNSHEMDFDR